MNKRTIIDAERMTVVEIISRRTTKDGRKLVRVMRITDAGATAVSAYEQLSFGKLNWTLTRRGDFTEMLESVLDARTVKEGR